MNIYISGISGTGMGPLALMAKDAGHVVFGTDLAEGPVTAELKSHEINFQIGNQDGSFLEKIAKEHGIDWFVHTSALPAGHPELKKAKDLGLKVSKRDEFLSFLIKELDLKLVAVAGTHGKTTTTAMLIWAAKELGLPVSYLVGTTLPFAPAGKYKKGDKFFIYEADEYDRNFLHFHPWLGIITSVSYDHPDIYPTPEDYHAAFAQFEAQSERIIHDDATDSRITLSGELRRQDATTALKALEIIEEHIQSVSSTEQNINILNNFPGAGRRFEKISDGAYSDYAHHPEEITATIKMAIEEAEKTGKKGVVVLYQPHQNTRQHHVKDGYKDAFSGVEKLFWLPTYLTREDESLPIISPAEFIASLNLPPEVAEPADLTPSLASRLKALNDDGYLILLLTAGPADTWFREQIKLETIKAWLKKGSINIFGRPMSGKDTVGKRLAADLDAQFLSSGDIIRKMEHEQNSHITDTGVLLPTNQFYDVVLPYFSHPELKDSPLVLSSIGRWEGEETEVMSSAKNGGHEIKVVIELKISEDAAKNRWEAAKTLNDRGARADDSSPEVFETRLDEYREKTAPVLKHYKELSLLEAIDGEKFRDEVYASVIDVLYLRAKGE